MAVKESDREKILKVIEKDVENSFSDEDVIHYVLETKISVDEAERKVSFADRAADGFAKFAGSWTFIIGFSLCLIGWIIINAVVLVTKAFDPYPFILLNLVLSCVAAIQAPIIMMSQNRQEEKDRRRAENDYKVNLKNELIIEDIHKKLDRIIELQEKHLKDHE